MLTVNEDGLVSRISHNLKKPDHILWLGMPGAEGDLDVAETSRLGSRQVRVGGTEIYHCLDVNLLPERPEPFGGGLRAPI